MTRKSPHELPQPSVIDTVDLIAIEREAHRMRAEALADIIHRAGHGLARMIARLFHIGGRPAHG